MAKPPPPPPPKAPPKPATGKVPPAAPEGRRDSSGKLPAAAPSSGKLPAANPSSGNLPAATPSSSGKLPATPPSSSKMRAAPPAPPAPANPDAQLAEVERALSVLDGRHPNALRAERHDQAAKAARKVALDEEAVLERKAALRRRVMYAVVAACIVAVGAMLMRYRARSRELDEALDRAGADYVRLGFATLASSSLRAPDRLETSAEAGCFVAVVVPADASVKVDHGTTTVRGQRSVAWCACATEPVTVTFTSTPPREGAGLRVLHADGKSIGGSAGLRFLAPAPGVIATGTEECASDFFDGWIAAKKNPPTNVDDKWLEADPKRKQLAALGLRPMAGASPDLPFAATDAAAKHCFVAMSTAESDALSLRVPGGDRPIARAKGTIAWCDAREVRFVVERDGLGELFVLGAPSKSTGGMLGLRSLLAGTGTTPVATWVRPDDLPGDASDAITAFGGAEATLTHAGTEKGKELPGARVVTISQGEPGVVSVDTPPETFWLCAPSLDEKPLQAMCVQSKPQVWRASGAAPAGIAQSKLPAWMGVFEAFNDPALVNAQHALLVMARTLARERFEPTTLEGVSEQPKGADVLGRAGEDAVIAVTLAPEAPWAFPLTDGEAWKIGGAPRVVPIKPGERLALSSTPPPTGTKEARRTVVFRRQSR